MCSARRKSWQTNLQSKQIAVHLSDGSLRLTSAGLVPNQWGDIQATADGSATADGMDAEAKLGWRRARRRRLTRKLR